MSYVLDQVYRDIYAFQIAQGATHAEAHQAAQDAKYQACH